MKREQGIKNRISGANFERRVRKDLEKRGYIVSRWQNNITDNKVVPAKSNRFNMRTTGFPDFIAYKLIEDNKYNILMVEVKTNGYLDKTEKEKAKFYIDNKYCNNFLIAHKKERKIKWKSL